MPSSSAGPITFREVDGSPVANGSLSLEGFLVEDWSYEEDLEEEQLDFTFSEDEYKKYPISSPSLAILVPPAGFNDVSLDPISPYADPPTDPEVSNITQVEQYCDQASVVVPSDGWETIRKKKNSNKQHSSPIMVLPIMVLPIKSSHPPQQSVFTKGKELVVTIDVNGSKAHHRFASVWLADMGTVLCLILSPLLHKVYLGDNCLPLFTGCMALHASLHDTVPPSR
ncbi:hypothetical protein POTOM_005800 [Populus tomentosa]|uniref:Uncharacterized protein n=1 Tax=Populus tomentosa TaxID=118781 RepID=A0A8X8D6V1_POPTO|nr:hypothetical protein POTOM_005800 [Populus tomentosa]